MPIDDKEHSSIMKEFSRFAYKYDTYNIIQTEVASLLVDKISMKHYAHIIDIGCGSGEVYKNILKHKIHFDKFTALDFSSKMLDIHPSAEKVKKIVADFNALDTIKKITCVPNETLIVSSSALQWSQNIDFVLSELAEKADKAYFSIFTSNTFKTLHHIANIQSPIYSLDVLKSSIEKFYHANFELKEYTLKFETPRDMFGYIKKSGVSGGKRQLSYSETKQLMNRYPLDYLEFEIVIVEATSLACK